MANPRETWARMQTILDEVGDALADAGYPVSITTVEPGPVAWDYCCGDGHLYIRLVRVHPSNPFPQQSLEPRNCDLVMAAQIEVGVLRCAPTMDPQGNSPKPEEVTATADQIVADMSIVYSVLKSHVPVWANFPPVLDNWQPLGPEGGCAGGAWTAWIDVAICPPTPTSPTSP